jgi:PAS domain S-box-containing protein
MEESLWIEIIRGMESLYADLADAQTDAEEKNEELLRAKAFVDNIIRSMVNSLVVVDRDWVITVANDACCRLLGYDREDLLGGPLGKMFAEGAPNPALRGSASWGQLRRAGRVTELETTLRTRRGQHIPVSLNASLMSDPAGAVTGIVLVATDLREAKRLLREARGAAAAERQQAAERAKAYRELKALQARLIQSEKMSSLGRMAASVAHEINNPLGAIVVYSHLLLEATPEDAPGRSNLEKIVRQATRCQNIVRGLLDFARLGPGVRQAADVNAIILAAHDLQQAHGVPEEIEVKLDLSPTPLEITCDPSQLQQAFTNLLVNAAEAIEGPGRITVRSWRDPERHRVAASFADTGCGIPSDDLARLFEPFFTTKQEGHGTGLGLAIAYGIAERHQGTIEVESRVGEGSTFTVWLPSREAEGNTTWPNEPAS